MTGKFSTKDVLRCDHYARFMSHLTLPQANAIFWLLFFLVLFLMCISSIQHHKSIALGAQLNDLEKALTPKEASKQKRNIRRRRVHQLSLVSLCLVLSLAATIFEVFALFNIEFCDGEDLMQMYWIFWSVLQVGSNIAILGVMVQFWIVLGDHETPSWAVALGTPVLVFAALGFVLKSVWLQFWDRCRGKRGPEVKDSVELDESGNTSETEADAEKCDRVRSMSQAPTLVPNTKTAPREGVQRSSTFWSRDLHYLLNSVVSKHQRTRHA